MTHRIRRPLSTAIAAASSSSRDGSSSSSDSSREQSISLKVMRLSLPTFKLAPSALCESSDLPAETLLTNKYVDLDVGLSELLTLPQSFGSIYLGEEFASYLSIHNSSSFDVASLCIKAELQTATKRFPLLDVPSSQIPAFPAGSSHDYVVKHNVVEEGTHMLVCSATYIKHDGEKKFFRKFFKFNVESPFSIKAKSHTVQRSTFLEVQLQNRAKEQLFIDGTTLRPAAHLECTDLNTDTSSDYSHMSSRKREISQFDLMKPGEWKTVLYQLSPKQDVDAKDLEHKKKGVEAVGTLDITWRTPMGSIGRISKPLSRKSLSRHAISFEILDVPKVITLEVPFTVTCQVTNNTSKIIAVRLAFNKNKMAGIMVNGVSGQLLGRILGNESRQLQLSLFPLLPGVQTITGVRIVEEQGRKQYDFDNVLEVFVDMPELSASTATSIS